MKPIILPLLGLILTLSILTGFTPRILPNVHGASGVLNPVTNWSPLGPREQNLVLKIYSQYSDSLDALADFGSGKLDIVDVPVSAASIPGVSCTNPEFVCTSPIGAQGDQYPALRGWDFSSVPPGTQSSIVSVANHGFQTGSGFWSLLNMRQLPDFDACKIPGAPSNCSVYQPGAGDETIRRSITQPPNGLAQLSPFLAHTPGEPEVLSLVYDSMPQVQPMTV